MGLFKKIKQKINKQQSNDIVVDAIKTSRKDNLDKYDTGLKKSRDSFIKKIKTVIVKNREINDEFFTDLEETLILADVGPSYSAQLVKELKFEAKLEKATTPNETLELILEKMFSIYMDDEVSTELNIKKGELNVILIIGVNGSGKTTSIGKMVKKLTSEDWKVTLAAADTFRAGAVAQLDEWAKKTSTPIVKPEKEGQDPASVVYKGIQEAKDNNSDVLIIDTAGRLHNKKNLMAELEKMYKIIEKETGKPADETLLVLDGTTGSNGINQASAFNEVAKLTGIIITKMDSSAKGGIILSIKDTFNLPVKYIGLGESLDDLEKFDITKYLYGLTKDILLEEKGE